MNIGLSNIQIHNEMMNKSDLLILQRNSVTSIDLKPYVNNTLNLNNEERKLTFEHQKSSQLVNNITNANNSTMLNERSGSIFSNVSSKSAMNKMNTRISILAKHNSAKLSRITKDNAKNFARFSQLTHEHNIEEKLDEIKDENSGESSQDSFFDDNLDSSGDEKIKKNSIYSKNNSIFEGLSITELHRLKEDINQTEIYNGSTEKKIIQDTSFECNENSNTDIKYTEQLLYYLKTNRFYILYQKISNKEISSHDLIMLDDEKAGEWIELENQKRFINLKKFINDLDDARDYEELLRKIDKDIFKGKYLFRLDKENL